MKRTVLFSVLLLLVWVSQGLCQPSPGDFAYGISLSVSGDSPLYELDIPDKVYQTVTDPALGDLRVFNADNQVVPHSILRQRPYVKDQPPSQETKPIPLFPVYASKDAPARPTHIRIETDGSGAVLDIFGGQPDGSNTYVDYYILDCSSFDRLPDSIKVDWTHEDGSYVSRVDVLASSDLSRWRRIVDNAALVDMAFGDNRLVRDTIQLPRRTARYLKLSWPKGRAGAGIQAVQATFILTPKKRKTKADEIRRKYSATRGEAREYLFETPGYYPVHRIKVLLPQQNTLVRASIYNRMNPESPWKKVYTGLIYDLALEGAHIYNEDIVVKPQAAPYWRMVLDQKEGGLGDRLPVLQLAYSPHTLCFVAQGNPPFVLAFGSGKIKQGGPVANPLLKDISLDTKPSLIRMAKLGDPFAIQGDAALIPHKEPPPWKRIFLWAILVGGVGAIGLMAWNLFRQGAINSGQGE